MTVAFVGCSAGQSGIVTGTITVDGKPVDGLQVEFVPKNDGTATAIGFTTNGGQYELMYGRGKKLIPAGEYLVTVGVFRESGSQVDRDLKLGKNYTSLEETELKATVTGGNNPIDFALKTK
ncbi:hypothetical protein AB1L30_15095 [Bremerella sp. JC817]|uniref:hypothetical protein n=1 Tax=Bremerella sp. JC817 TaxID=3231756 RepID=UPI00345A75E6